MDRRNTHSGIGANVNYIITYFPEISTTAPVSYTEDIIPSDYLLKSFAPRFSHCFSPRVLAPTRTFWKLTKANTSGLADHLLFIPKV